MPGEASLDEAGDDRTALEGALHHEAFRQPGFEVIAQHVLGEEFVEIEPVHWLQSPDRHSIVVTDKAQRRCPHPLQPPREQHGQGSVGEPPFERIDHHEVTLAARKGLQQQVVGRRDQRVVALDFQPLSDIGRQHLPVLLVVHQLADPPRQEGRERELRPAPGRHFRIAIGCGADQHLRAGDADQRPDLACEHEGVSGVEHLEHALLDLSDLAAAAPRLAHGDAHREHSGRDDGADVQAVALGGLGVAHAPQTVLAHHDPAEPVIGLERVAAGRDKIDDLLEVLPDQVAIGAGRTHFVIERQEIERLGAGAAHHVLGQHVERADPGRFAVETVLGYGLPGGLALQHLEPIGGHEQRATGLIQPVVGAADPLDHPRGALGRGQLDDQVDVAPVDAQVERGGADHGPEFAARHRRLHLATLLGGQAAVVQGDGQVVVVETPQFLEGELGLETGVDEYQGGPGSLDGVVDLLHRVFGGVAGPRHPAF